MFCHRICMVSPLPVDALYRKFVFSTNEFVRDEDFPYSARPKVAHRMTGTIPLIEAADQSHALRIWGPDGERRASHFDLVIAPAWEQHRATIRSKRSPEKFVPAFTDQVQIEIAYRREKDVGVVTDAFEFAVSISHSVCGNLGSVEHSDENASILVSHFDVLIVF